MIVSSVTVTILIVNESVTNWAMVVPILSKGCAWLCWLEQQQQVGELFSLQVVTAAHRFGNGVILSRSFGLGIYRQPVV